MTDDFMTAVGDLLEYTIDDEVERNSSKELDTFVFTVTTVGNGGLATGHMYMDTYTFAKHRDWMYETTPDEYGGKTYVGLKVEYDKDANQVKLQWAGGYVDKYGYGSNRTETFTWYGKPSPEDPLVFISDTDSKKFKIVNDGTAVNWDGYTFYKVK